MTEEPRYGFHPLERRGVLLGLDAGQMATMAGGVVAALVTRAAISGPAGMLLAVATAIGTLVSTLWTRDGRSLAARAAVAAAWLARGASRAQLDDTPLSGRLQTGHCDAGGAGSHRPGAHRPRRHRTEPEPPGLRPPGIVLSSDPGLPGDAPIGIVRDRRSGTCAAVLPVQGCSYCLLDPGEQVQRLEGWRRVLGSLARPGSPVVKVQWLQRSWIGADGQARVPEEAQGHGGPNPAASSYAQLLDTALPALANHRVWLALVVELRPPGEAVTALRRELRLLEGQLRAADLKPLHPLGPDELAELVGQPSRTAGAPACGAWPLARREGWSAYQTDAFWHATYWVAEWPRTEVGPDFLAPLLLTSARTAVSLLMAPVPSDRAMREVRSARTADLADAQLRARAGFLQSARRERETVGVARREEELADGHQEFRFSGYVTVSAEGEDQLAAACAEVEHAAQSARLELRRLFGRQAEAYTWTLPLGRGLR